MPLEKECNKLNPDWGLGLRPSRFNSHPGAWDRYLQTLLSYRLILSWKHKYLSEIARNTANFTRCVLLDDIISVAEKEFQPRADRVTKTPSERHWMKLFDLFLEKNKISNLFRYLTPENNLCKLIIISSAIYNTIKNNIAIQIWTSSHIGVFVPLIFSVFLRFFLLLRFCCFFIEKKIIFCA